MKTQWLSDARNIPDEVMNYLRRIAVRAVEEKHYSPEVIADILGIRRSSLYDWLRGYREEREEALDAQSAPGAPPVITEEMGRWLKTVVLTTTPVGHGYDTRLWPRDLLAKWLNQRLGIQVAGNTVSLHLRRLGLSYPTPAYRASEQGPAQVAAFLEVEFPRIQRLAAKLGADIGFEDEAGVGGLTRSGRTWGAVGQPPKVAATDQRGDYNVLSIITAEGELLYSLETARMDGKRYLAFLRQLLRARSRPLIVMADRASFHRSAWVRRFVRAHRTQIRVFFFPTHSAELNPDEPVWNEMKHRQIGKQSVTSKIDLKKRNRLAPLLPRAASAGLLSGRC